MKNILEWVLKDNVKRDTVLILPGGGYERCSLREAMPVAKRVNEAGMHAVIFWYRNEKLLYPFIKDEGIEMIHQIKGHPLVSKLFITGFSAGAHLGLMLSIAKPDLIDKTVLAYPVVSTEIKLRHEASFKNLTGSLEESLLNEVSLEKHVHSKMKPVFMMHTADDASVPVENSLVLSEALSELDIPFELHIYPRGRHGLSLGTKDTSFDDMDPMLFESEYKDVAGWFDLALAFMKRSIKHD